MLPVTLLFGPSASYNLLSILMPGLLCYAMYRAARLWLPSQTGAIAAGGFFGLSSIMAWHAWYQLNLAAGALFMPLALEAAVRLRRNPCRKQAVILGVIAGGSLLTDQESFVLVLILIVGALLPWLAGPLLRRARAAPVAAPPPGGGGRRRPGMARQAGGGRPGRRGRAGAGQPADRRDGGAEPVPAARRFPAGAVDTDYALSGANFPGSSRVSPHAVRLGLTVLRPISYRGPVLDGVLTFGLDGDACSRSWRDRLVAAAQRLAARPAVAGQRRPRAGLGAAGSAPTPTRRSPRSGTACACRRSCPTPGSCRSPGWPASARPRGSPCSASCLASPARGRRGRLAPLPPRAAAHPGARIRGARGRLGGQPPAWARCPPRCPAVDGPIAADHSSSIVVDVPFGVRGGVPLPGEGAAFDPESQVLATADGHPRAVGYLSRLPESDAGGHPAAPVLRGPADRAGTAADGRGVVHRDRQRHRADRGRPPGRAPDGHRLGDRLALQPRRPALPGQDRLPARLHRRRGPGVPAGRCTLRPAAG